MNLEQNVLIQGMQYEITKALDAQKESGFIQYDPCNKIDIYSVKVSGGISDTKLRAGERKPLSLKEREKRRQKRRLTKQARRAGR